MVADQAHDVIHHQLHGAVSSHPLVSAQREVPQLHHAVGHVRPILGHQLLVQVVDVTCTLTATLGC